MVKLIVEEIPPLYMCCDRLIAAVDIASAVRFQNERRRMEHLAWRRIVRRELGLDVIIDYNDVGAPVVSQPNRRISVAHGGGMVAVAIADIPVGVDIESLERDFSMASSRYLSVEESQLSDDARWSAMVWTAKEAMYKLYGRRGVDLRTELQVIDYDASSMVSHGIMGGKQRVTVEYSLFDERYVVAVATER